MKKSDLRRIIKEELVNVLEEARLDEGFADPEIRKLARLGGIEAGRWTNFFKSFANTHDIAWDQLPKGTLNKTTNMNDPLIKNGLAFFVIENDKQNPYGGNRYFDQTLRAGVMAATLNGKVLYYYGNRGRGTTIGPGGGYKAGQAVGAGVRGTLQLKKLKELADYVYVMDFETFRGGTKALKAKRAELKLGKDKFKDDVAMPEQVALRNWTAAIKFANHFLGCDSVGQHLAYMVDTPSTVVLGPTYPINVTYTDFDYLYIVDLGMKERVYDPIRIMPDETTSRHNEHLMSMTADIHDYIIDRVLGKPEPKEDDEQQK